MLTFVNTALRTGAGADLEARWNPSDRPFYLEIGGESAPISTADASAAATPRTYEYTWTLAHPGGRPGSETHWHGFGRRDSTRPLWERLAESPAARVYMYFPTVSGWRVQEVTATVRYLSPARVHQGILDEIGKVLKVTSPLAADAEGVAKLLPGGSLAANWLDVVAKLQVQSVPQTEQFGWSAEKVTMPGATDGAGGIMDGVLFNLPRSMFEFLGGRITGSIAVTVTQTAATVATGNLLAHASVITDDGVSHWVPGVEPNTSAEFLRLPITPVTS